MARLFPGLVGGVLLASVTFGVAAAGAEYCLAYDETTGPCPAAGDSGVDPSLVAPADNLSPGTDPVLPDAQPTPAVTRTLGPPTVVQPFAVVAVPAAAQPDEVAPARILPADQQKLPPGPPSRIP